MKNGVKYRGVFAQPYPICLSCLCLLRIESCSVMFFFDVMNASANCISLSLR